VIGDGALYLTWLCEAQVPELQGPQPECLDDPL
jgi:hypothetical protein